MRTRDRNRSSQGLATVQRIAKAIGGGVALETGGGRGAAFKVHLPGV